eukprot:4719898-Amphidinium_carterae.1
MKKILRSSQATSSNPCNGKLFWIDVCVMALVSRTRPPPASIEQKGGHHQPKVGQEETELNWGDMGE